MSLTLAQYINLQAELERTDPPNHVRQALKSILAMVNGNRTPPLDLINIVQHWLGRRTQQNRYGK
jgi:hypothetical protein